MRATVGIDCGSAACKGVLMIEGNVESHVVLPSTWNPADTAREVLRHLLDEAGLSQSDVVITATGYGRVGIDFAQRAVTEITCHALGAAYLLPGVRTVIDIGGQDSKAISIEEGRVMAFQMNDKCAAGTGRFLEMSAQRLGMGMDDLSHVLSAGEYVKLSSMCAVFADSEIVSLLAAGQSRQAIAGGVLRAIAARTVALAARIDVKPPVLLTGGLSHLKALRAVLSELLELPVQAHTMSRYAGAIGASLARAKKRGGENARRNA